MFKVAVLLRFHRYVKSCFSFSIVSNVVFVSNAYPVQV